MKLRFILIVSIVLSMFLIACGGGKKKKSADKAPASAGESSADYQKIMVNSNGQLISVPKHPQNPNDYDYIMVGPDKNIIAVPASEVNQNPRQAPPAPYVDVLQQPAYR